MNEVISTESANKMIVLLSGVVDGGTGSRLRFKYNLQGEICAKTGTTNRNSDAWFMGFTPQLVSGCWVGGEDRDIHFDSMRMGQGASMALPIWAIFMKKCMPTQVWAIRHRYRLILIVISILASTKTLKKGRWTLTRFLNRINFPCGHYMLFAITAEM